MKLHSNGISDVILFKELIGSLTMTGLLELKVFLIYDEKESSQLVLTCQ